MKTAEAFIEAGRETGDTVDEFARVDLRVALVRQAERIKGADLLLKLEVDLTSVHPTLLISQLSYLPRVSPRTG